MEVTGIELPERRNDVHTLPSYRHASMGLCNEYDGVRRDAGEVLFDIPRAPAVTVTQTGHDGEQVVDVRRSGHGRFS